MGAVDEPAPVENRATAAVRTAVHEKRALTIDYYAASRDTLTTRTVDPIRVLLIGGQSYLEAWSREADGVRLFRFDRIVDATVLDEPAAPLNPRCRRRRTRRCSTATRRCRRQLCASRRR